MDYNAIFEEEYARLNTQQKQAVDTIYGPIMVVAGPGTGKTQIIGLRTANIIKQTGMNPDNILITTFTDAGVVAIRERLISFLGNDAYKVQVSTIHSLCQDIIKTFPEKFLQYKASNPIDEVDSLELIKHLIDTGIKNKEIITLTSDYDPYFYLRDIKAQISQLKQEGVSFNKFEKSIEQQEELYIEELGEIKPTLKKYETTQKKQEKHILKLKELLVLYKNYKQLLRERELYDFNDMIQFAGEQMQIDDELQQHYAQQYQFIMLDEYQDTNNAQNQIINTILDVSEDQKNIMVVGDDDQSIYRFQGANIENMLDFSVHFSDTTFIVLENNYRSSQGILNTVESLIGFNSQRLCNKIESIEKKLISSGKEKTNSDIPTLYRASSDIDEKAYILESINNLIDSGEPLDQIAIIVRGNREVIDWTKLLLQNKILAESKLKSNILESKYINFILDFLYVILDPHAHEEKCINILRSDIMGVSQNDILQINRALYIKNYSKKYPEKIIDFIGSSDFVDLELPDEIVLCEFKEKLLTYASMNASENLVHFFNHFIDDIGLIDFINTNGEFSDLQDVYTLFNKIKSFCYNRDDFSVQQLLSKIELYKTYKQPINRQIIASESAGIQILTAHGSKGLEYNHVFIPGLYSGNWESKRIINKLKLPSFIAGNGLQDTSYEPIQEDRRLFFVALSRAKKQLHLSFPSGINTKTLLASAFIEEISETITEIDLSIDNKKYVTVIENDIKNSLISYTKNQIDYIGEFLVNYKLSASDLNTFLEDPLVFLQRAVFKYPFIDNQYTVFGKLYHQCLEEFYLSYKSQNILPTLGSLLQRFEQLLHAQFINPEEKELLQQKAIDGFTGYHEIIKNNPSEVIALEYSFRRKNIHFNNIPLTGTIDKIEEASNQDSITTKVNVIDYKTGKTKSIGEIKGLDRYGNKKEGGEYGKYERQLLFYKLLCENDPEFTQNYTIENLSIDFAEGKDDKYKVLPLETTLEEYEDFKKVVEESWKKINDLDFWRDILKVK